MNNDQAIEKMNQVILNINAHVFALYNPDYPGLLYIDMTHKPLNQVINKINQSSLTDYTLVFSKKTLKYKTARELISETLEPCRHSKSFYDIDIETLELIFSPL